MLRYKTETRPGLVALYDIRPGNGAGPFLQTPEPAWSMEVAVVTRETLMRCSHTSTRHNFLSTNYRPIVDQHDSRCYQDIRKSRKQ